MPELRRIRRDYPRAAALFICLIISLPTTSALANDASDCTQTTDYALAIRACTARIETLRKLQGGLVTGLIAGGYFGDRAIADALNKRGVAYDHLGNHSQAIADYNQAMTLAPNSPLLYLNRGAARGGMGDYAAALVDFDRAIALQSNFAEAYAERALAHLRLGQKDQALPDAERAVQLLPRSTLTLGVRGEVYAALGRTEEAVVDYRTVLALDPTQHTVAEAIRRLGFQP